MLWTVPQMWAGQTVAILASGPSMSQAVADQVRCLPTIAINTTYRLAPLATMLYAADPEWWQAHPDALRFGGLKVSVSDVKGVMRLRNSGNTGFDPDPSALRTGGNSGYQALHIAAHAGAARVLLCGYNMGGEHWHGPHPQGLRATAQEVYARWLERFDSLAPILAKRGVDVVNVTPNSALKCFRTSTLDAEIEGCRAL